VAMLSILSVCSGAFNPSMAGDVDLLIQKLVEKGILTQDEARELLQEMQREKIKEKTGARKVAKEAVKQEAKEETKNVPLDFPAWVRNTKISGDFRLRYQGQDQIDPSDMETQWRNRGRMRLRLGAETKVTDGWKAGFQLATGDGNPRSTNVTLGDFFSGKDIRIRKAYAEYRPRGWLRTVGGKFSNPLFRPKDMLWDTDVTPEGIAANLKYRVHPGLDIIFTPTLFALREFDLEDDVYVCPMQLGLEWRIREDIKLQLATTYYNFQGLKGRSAPTYSSMSNTLVQGRYIYDYDSIAADAALGFKLPYKLVPYVELYGQYINADTNNQDTGYCGGFKLGHAGVKELGQWQLGCNYRYLERNAWVDFLPDSEFFGGSTNAKGYEVEFYFGLASQIHFKLDWYSTRKIDKQDPALKTIGQDIVFGFTEQELLQLDLVLNF
jgi:hypothetical protein